MKRCLLVLGLVASLLLAGCGPSKPPLPPEEPGPSEDSFLVVHNNGGHFVGLDGAVYFRQYTADSLEETAPWGDVGYLPGAETQMMRLDEEGEMSQLFATRSQGPIFIYRDGKGDIRFLLTEVDAEGFFWQPNLFSVLLDGSQRVELGQGIPLALDVGSGVLAMDDMLGGLTFLPLEHPEQEQMVGPAQALLGFDEEEGVLYCADNQPDWPGIVAYRLADGKSWRILDDTSAIIEEAFDSQDEGQWDYGFSQGLSAEEHLFALLQRYDSVWGDDDIGYWVRIHKEKGDWEIVGVEGDFHLGPYLSVWEVEALGYDVSPNFGEIYEKTIAVEETFYTRLMELETVGEATFFILSTGPRNWEDDWNYYVYDRGVSGVYRRDDKSGEIQLLYGF